jgi:hypothetical protein
VSQAADEKARANDCTKTNDLVEGLVGWGLRSSGVGRYEGGGIVMVPVTQ